MTCGELGEIDIRIGDGVADMRAVDAPLALRGHRLHVHDFLVIGAVVMYDVQQRDAVMRGRPERAWREHQVAVAADRDGQAAVLAMGQGRPNAGARQIAQAVGAGVADVLVVVVGGPQLLRPVVLEDGAVAQRPVLVADLLVELRAQARGGDRL